GETLAALASAAGLDPVALAGTVTRWNRSCDAGRDAEFGRKLMLQPLGDGPYYAIELSPSMLNTQGGPRRSEKAQIMRPNGPPLPPPLQRRRARLDLQLSLPRHRQYWRMPGLRPHRRPQRGGGDALGLGYDLPGASQFSRLGRA